MAWRCGGSTNEELINNLFKNGLITSARVRDAMTKVDRAHYCPDPSTAYEDSPQLIGHEATISAPHMHANAAESLLSCLHPSATVLDIGSGSGYLTAVLANLVDPLGSVVGIEHIQALADLGKHNMEKSEEGRKMLADGKVRFVKGDGRKGWTGEGGEDGWDVIHVGAAAIELHSELIMQLKKPGRMFIPVEDTSNSFGDQYIWVVDKSITGEVTRKKLYGVRYVPLKDAP